MNLLEQQLDYPFGEQLPAPGCCVNVAPGVRWLRMGLPFALNHISTGGCCVTRKNTRAIPATWCCRKFQPT